MSEEERRSEGNESAEVREKRSSLESFVEEATRAQEQIPPEEQGHFYGSPNLTSRYGAIANYLSGETGMELLLEQIGIMLWYRGELSGDPLEYGMWVLEVPEADIAEDLWNAITGREG